MPTIFVSCSLNDRSYREEIIRQLRIIFENEDIFYDDKAPTGGGNQKDWVYQRISTIDVFIVLITKSSLTDLKALDEFHEAIRLKKKYIIVSCGLSDSTTERNNLHDSLPSDVDDAIRNSKWIEVIDSEGEFDKEELVRLTTEIKNLSQRRRFPRFGCYISPAILGSVVGCSATIIGAIIGIIPDFPNLWQYFEINTSMSVTVVSTNYLTVASALTLSPSVSPVLTISPLITPSTLPTAVFSSTPIPTTTLTNLPPTSIATPSHSPPSEMPTLIPTATLTLVPSITLTPTFTATLTDTPIPTPIPTFDFEVTPEPWSQESFPIIFDNNLQSVSSLMVYAPVGCFNDGLTCVGHFWIDADEVDNEQYRLCVNGDSDPCTLPANLVFQDLYYDLAPAVNVDWFMAYEYCQRRNGRLPTENEWLYAVTHLRHIDLQPYAHPNQSDVDLTPPYINPIWEWVDTTAEGQEHPTNVQSSTEMMVLRVSDGAINRGTLRADYTTGQEVVGFRCVAEVE